MENNFARQAAVVPYQQRFYPRTGQGRTSYSRPFLDSDNSFDRFHHNHQFLPIRLPLQLTIRRLQYLIDDGLEGVGIEGVRSYGGEGVIDDFRRERFRS